MAKKHCTRGMVARPPSIQWYYKQYLGDNHVLAMEWDASGMHTWLLNLSIQETPPGSIPNDMAVIRRWLRNPPDDVWRRVQPQIFTAWKLRDDRWFNDGIVRSCERRDAYAIRYKVRNKDETSTKSPPKSIKTEEEVVFAVGSKESKVKPSLEEVVTYCVFRGKGVDPHKWYDHYEANGWKVGRNAMKDWRAAVRTWEGSELGGKKNHVSKREQDFEAAYQRAREADGEDQERVSKLSARSGR